MSTNRNERVATLQATGIDTSEYFSLNVENATAELNESTAEIYANGYVKNTMLHRRWVMAQMFRMMNYKSADGSKKGYVACLNREFPYKYQFTMMLEEIRVISKLENSDAEAFAERTSFFNKDVVLATCREYFLRFNGFVSNLRVKYCQGKPYKRIRGKDYFIEDINRMTKGPLKNALIRMENSENYSQLYTHLKKFVSKMIRLPEDTAKCAEWKRAYQQAGSYYTMKNLIMFHNCTFVIDDRRLTQEESMEFINRKRIENGNAQRNMFTHLKDLISDSNFNYAERMREIFASENTESLANEEVDIIMDTLDPAVA